MIKGSGCGLSPSKPAQPETSPMATACRYSVAIARPGAQGVAVCTGVEEGGGERGKISICIGDTDVASIAVSCRSRRNKRHIIRRRITSVADASL